MFGLLSSLLLSLLRPYLPLLLALAVPASWSLLAGLVRWVDNEGRHHG
jgi:hypothetical protein